MTKRFLLQFLFLIAAAGVLSNYRVFRLPRLHGQATASPVVFAVKNVIHRHHVGKADEITGDRIMTRYADGTYTEDASIPTGLPGERTVRSEFPDGRVEAAVGPLGLKSTIWKSAEEVARLAEIRAARIANNCIDPRTTEHVLWLEDVLGIKTVLVQRPPSQIHSYKLVHTEWRAPSLGCIAVKLSNKTYAADGSEYSEVIYEPEYIRQSVGSPGPDPAVALYSETKPSTIHQAWADRIKAPAGIPCMSPERMTRMDNDYAKHQRKP
jgi:hypothetical protein